MTVIRRFFCDYCNPDRKPEAPDDDGTKSFTTTIGHDFPLGWWEVPGKGPGGNTGHACPSCVLHDENVKDDIVKRRSEVTERMTS